MGISLALLLAALALAAGPVKGGTYNGVLSHSKAPIKLKVAKNGKSVTASVERPPLYCEGGFGPVRQVTKPATVASNGSFTATIGYESTFNHTTFAKLVVKGKLAGRNASGSARSEFKVGSKCDGSTSFSAKAK